MKKKNTPSDCTIGATEDTGKRPAKKQSIPAAAGLATVGKGAKSAAARTTKSATAPAVTAKAGGKKKSATTLSKDVDIASLKPQPFYGISRIDQPEKKNFGWYLRLNKTAKFFPDKKCGSRAKALALAKAERDLRFPLLPLKLQKIGSRKRKTYA